jgi:hypothetical protein
MLRLINSEEFITRVNGVTVKAAKLYRYWGCIGCKTSVRKIIRFLDINLGIRIGDQACLKYILTGCFVNMSFRSLVVPDLMASVWPAFLTVLWNLQNKRLRR